MVTLSVWQILLAQVQCGQQDRRFLGVILALPGGDEANLGVFDPVSPFAQVGKLLLAFLGELDGPPAIAKQVCPIAGHGLAAAQGEVLPFSSLEEIQHHIPVGQVQDDLLRFQIEGIVVAVGGAGDGLALHELARIVDM